MIRYSLNYMETYRNCNFYEANNPTGCDRTAIRSSFSNILAEIENET